MLKVLTPATKTRLATLDDIRLEIPETLDADSQVKLGRYLDAASNLIERYTRRVFSYQTYEESRAFAGDPIAHLTRVPVVSLDSVFFDGIDYTNETKLQDRYSGRIFRGTGFTSTETLVGPIAYEPYSLGEEKWVFTYKAGYRLPGDNNDLVENQEDLPAEIRDIAVQLTVHQYRMRESGAIQGVRSVDVGESSMEFSSESNTASMPKNLMRRLDHWRLTF